MSPARLSVCIPAYEMNGHGADYLRFSFQKLVDQDFSCFEIIVSDQSKDQAVFNLCCEWSNRLNILHVWNTDQPRQASSNINHAIEIASGEVIKILFQDDFLCDNRALSRIYNAMMYGKETWALAGSGVTRGSDCVINTMVPKLFDGLQFGKNTVSSPSVVAFKRGCRERFDTNLVWLMDVEFYNRMWRAHGDPIILAEPLIANRLHNNQVSEQITRKIRISELKYVWEKSRATTSIFGKMEFFRQWLQNLLKA